MGLETYPIMNLQIAVTVRKEEGINHSVSHKYTSKVKF